MRGLEQIPWIYDTCCWVFERFGFAAWRRWLMGNATGRVLEIGCGTGRNLAMPSPAALLVGLDPSPHALARARHRAPRAVLVRGSAHDLPFRPGTFDTLVSGLAFCSVMDPNRGLEEAKRVLNLEGTLRMVEHVRSTRRWKARIQDMIQTLWTRVTGGCHPNRDTEASVARAGFNIDPAERVARGTLRRFSATRA
jgi:ubiquinone/menaquinone biosynthesis C-methylase UbiE